MGRDLNSFFFTTRRAAAARPASAAVTLATATTAATSAAATPPCRRLCGRHCFMSSTSYTNRYHNSDLLFWDPLQLCLFRRAPTLYLNHNPNGFNYLIITLIESKTTEKDPSSSISP